jgi:hypothetical protein
LATKPFAFNPSGTPPLGATQVGNIAVFDSFPVNSGSLFIQISPDDSSGYLLGKTSSQNRTYPIAGTSSKGFYVGNSIRFYRSVAKTDSDFITAVNKFFGQSFVSASAAKSWIDTNGHWTSYTSASYDSDAQAFFTSASITDTTQKSAVNQLVIDLKAYGIWTKISALYPFVGGTAESHKWNLKDPRDLNVAFRLVFSGGWIHNSNGITGNGTNAYADTFLSVQTYLLKSLGIYTRNSTDNNGTYIGHSENFNTTDPEGSTVYGYWIISSAFALEVNNLGGTPWLSNTNKSGFYSISNTGTQTLGYKNGVLNSSSGGTSPNNGNVDRSIKIGALSNVSSTDGVFDPGSDLISGYSNQNFALTYISTQTLSATEHANLNTAVQAFQTALSRNV